MIRLAVKVVATLAAASAIVATAQAQKASDTVRIGIHQPVSSIDGVFDPSPQTSMMSRMVLDHLVVFDPVKKRLRTGPRRILEAHRQQDLRVQSAQGREIS